MLTNETTLNASLISHNATSSDLTPACSRTFGMTRDGVMVKSTGAVAASANAGGYNVEVRDQSLSTTTS